MVRTLLPGNQTGPNLLTLRHVLLSKLLYDLKSIMVWTIILLFFFKYSFASLHHHQVKPSRCDSSGHFQFLKCSRSSVVMQIKVVLGRTSIIFRAWCAMSPLSYTKTWISEVFSHLTHKNLSQRWQVLSL